MSEDLFRQFWWLIFPISWFIFGAYQSWLSYRANRETLDLIKTYAAAGREPPAELLSKLNRRWLEDDHYERPRYRRRRERTWYHVVLYGMLSAGFGFAASTNIYGAGEAFTIVAFVLGAVCAATLVQVLLERSGPTI
ncbi:hypothetical protein [uncultured Caulobacter sp.]|uniref:hypothetical protein n=1 Tax=uncultured Caulobacter sp. TaxID=158749 RepID=UPI002627C30C|nr:hypothetical protein [uncultured Caulobacter sp.]